MSGGVRLRIVAISDTHGRHGDLRVPEGDVLVHAGDISRQGDLGEIEEFAAFLRELPHPHKLVIAGNHDWCFLREPQRARELLSCATYLQDEGCRIAGFGFWGSPWQPWFMDWAFNLPRGAALREKWSAIPASIDVLVTHTPPMGQLDRIWRMKHVGCEALAERVRELAPALHVFGHIHEGRGHAREGDTLYVNASTLDRGYRKVAEPIVIDLERREDRVHAEPLLA